MTVCRRSFFLVLICLVLVPVLAIGAEMPGFGPLDVFELEWASDPQISPDGNQIVYVRNSFDIMKDRRVRKLWLVSFDGDRHRPLTQRTESESAPRWSPDGSRILFVSSADGGSQLFVQWRDSGEVAQLTRLARSPRGVSWSPDGQWIAFSMHVPAPAPRIASMPPKPRGAEWAPEPKVINRLRNRADGSGYLEPGFAHIFIVPSDGGTPRQLTTGDFPHNAAPVWTPDSKSLLFSTNRNSDWEHDFRNSEIYSVSISGGPVEALTNRAGPDQNPVPSPDGRLIAYTGYDDQIQTYQVQKLYVMNRDGSESHVITRDLDRDISSPVWAADSSGIYFQFDNEGDTRLAFVDLNGEHRELTGGMGGTSVGRPYGGGSFSMSSGGRFAYTQTTPMHPADISVGTSAGATTTRITRLNDDLFNQRQLGAVEEIWWESSFDQRRVQGWIVKPPNFDASRRYPLLLEIHGGPVSNYGDRFSAEIQLYASAGHVVLYANPRGSTSYGREYGNLIHHNYPGEDYDDLISGVDAVIARGYVDPNRLFVTGGSAGGIMTAWIVGKTDRFRAAVAAKPVINWFSKVLVADNYFAYHKYRYEGRPWDNPDAYMKFSPISLVGNVSTPTMLMTGDQDLRTPLSEAEQFYHALKLRKIETALVRIPGASHNIAARPSQLITKVLHTLAWFDRYDSRTQTGTTTSPGSQK